MDRKIHINIVLIFRKLNIFKLPAYGHCKVYFNFRIYNIVMLADPHLLPVQAAKSSCLGNFTFVLNFKNKSTRARSCLVGPRDDNRSV